MVKNDSQGKAHKAGIKAWTRNWWEQPIDFDFCDKRQYCETKETEDFITQHSFSYKSYAHKFLKFKKR